MNLQKARAFCATLALVPAVFSFSCSKQPAPVAPTADTSSPKKVSLAFASAMVAGDSAAMRSMAVGTGGHLFAYYSSLADLVASQHLFTETLKAKFGDACKLPPEIEHIGNLPPMPANYDQLVERIDGDTATLVDAAGHPGVKLKKVDGNWKVDFATADAALPPDAPAILAGQLQQLASTKKSFDQATAKIIDGTYSDCKTALDAVMAVLGLQQ